MALADNERDVVEGGGEKKSKCRLGRPGSNLVG